MALISWLVWIDNESFSTGMRQNNHVVKSIWREIFYNTDTHKCLSGVNE